MPFEASGSTTAAYDFVSPVTATAIIAMAGLASNVLVDYGPEAGRLETTVMKAPGGSVRMELRKGQTFIIGIRPAPRDSSFRVKASFSMRAR